jgi:chromosome segregation ATPase
MLSQEKFHKLSKYTLRLEKSFIKNNSSNYLKYCSHLKHHIGGENKELNKMFEELITLINNNPEYKLDTLAVSNSTLTKEKDELINTNNTLTAEKEALTAEKDELIKTNNKLTEEKNTLTSEKEALTAEKIILEKKINKYNEIIKMINFKLNIVKNDDDDFDDEYKTNLENALNEFKKKLDEKESMYKTNDEQIKENNTKITELEKKIVELENKIKEQENTLTNLKLNLDQSNEEKTAALTQVEQSTKTNIKALEELKQTNYYEFKLQLSKLFNAIYPEPIANAIIQQMEVGEKVVEPEKVDVPEKVVELEKVVEPVKTKEEINKDLENTEFEIYSNKTQDKKEKFTLNQIKNAYTQGEKLNLKNLMLNKITKILKSDDSLEKKKKVIQEVINKYSIVNQMV